LWIGKKTNEIVTSLYPNFPYILCFAEHHLKQMQINHISIETYNLGANFCRGSFNKGGVCIFVYKSLKFSAISIQELCKDKDLEACAVKLEFPSTIICLITIYIALSANFQLFINGLETIIKKLYKLNLQIIICGDININLNTPGPLRMGRFKIRLIMY
jgi:exonuclease III